MVKDTEFKGISTQIRNNINEELRISINSHKDINMSNWEVTNTFDTLNSANNKMNILQMISEYIAAGGSKEDIFIMDKSFNIKTNYIDYFKHGSRLNISEYRSLQKVIYMGNIISFNFNENLANIQYILGHFYLCSTEVWNSLKLRLPGEILLKSIKMYRASANILDILEDMFINTRHIIDNAVSDSKTIQAETYQRLMGKLQNNLDLNLKKYNKYMADKAQNTHDEFLRAFKTRSRPIVGVYNDKDGYFDILNYEQMYMKGTLSKTDLRLISITRNSPIEIIISTVGIMSATMWYLHKRQQKVDNEDTPKTDFAVVDKLMGNEDDDIRNLGADTLNTINEVTNTNKVIVNIEEYRDHKNK